MANLSITSSITVPKVNVAAAAQLFSDRRLNPDEMTCPLWSGTDLTGRPVCVDSFNTKMEGCNTAEDRIFVENTLRPQYTNFVTINAAGIAGDGVYDSRSNLQATSSDSGAAYRRAVSGKTPQYGTVSDQKIRSLSGSRHLVSAAKGYSDQSMDANRSQKSRDNQRFVLGNQNNIMIANPSGNFEARPSAVDMKSTGNYISLRDYNQGVYTRK